MAGLQRCAAAQLLFVSLSVYFMLQSSKKIKINNKLLSFFFGSNFKKVCLKSFQLASQHVLVATDATLNV